MSSVLNKEFGKGEVADVSAALAAVLAVKGGKELDVMKSAGKLCSKAMKNACVKRMEDIIEDELSITHKAFSEEIEKKVQAPSQIKAKLAPEDCDVSLAPLVQSGGQYNFKQLGISSEDSKLSYDVLVFSLATKYKDYNAMLARTYLIDPVKEQEHAYKLLVKVHLHILQALKAGAVLGDVYDSAVDLIKKTDSRLVERFTSNCGWEMGILFRNKNYVIRSNNRVKAQAGMTFCIRVGFDSVPMTEKIGPKKLDKFSCLLADTVVVTATGTELLTKGVLEYGDVMYKLAETDDDDDDAEEEEEEVVVTGDTKLKRALRSSRQTKQQIAEQEKSQSLAKEIDEHQKKLMLDKAAKNSKLEVGREESDDEAQIEILKKYEDTSKYPLDLKRNQIYCDKDKECVLLPIFGYHVPFHISTIKSVSKSDEEHATLLRLNFFYPTSSAGFSRDVSPQMRAVLEQHPQLSYVKEMSFRSRDSHNLNHQLRLIKELQKRVRLRQKKKEIEADLVEQQELILTRTGKKPTLLDISMKPTLKNRKSMGRLVAHNNGFRFRTNRGEVYDIIYANIKHFFFQPCDRELIVLIHFHLHNPVMVGRTKTLDIQFYAEVVDGSTSLDQSRRKMYDPDEIDEENRERQLRKRLNQAFKSFCNQVIQVVEKNNLTIGQGNEYDIPYRALGFNGVPNKEMVLLMPTVYCLVNLTESPPFVVTLDDVEHIHFERTDFRVSKTFDMVFVLKKQLDFTNQDVPQRIQSIPVDKFDTIKQWIHEKGDLTFTCGNMSLNWKIIMTGVKEELERGVFWATEDVDGEKKPVGWNFLTLDDEQEGSGEDEEEEESEFEADPSGSESSDEEDW